ncbi:MAG TPA: serine/threonine-protein kinase [Candidatus Melainabacteria bacterium]|nr:serine/threonine-protein kinase [Candidatus Melainabacteria bacterium]
MSHDQSKDAAVGGSDSAPTFKKTGDLLARQYDVVELLGEGGASVVYRCKHAVLATDCAVKVLLPDRIPDQKVLQRFQLEAKSIGRLEHPNIVVVHEFGIDDENNPFLVMDFVDGKNLAQIIEEEGFLTPRRALALFIQIAEALAHAHSRAIIHRDLKPKNVIVERTGQKNECAKLVDFGIAKITEAENENKSLTQTGEIFGSPLFMSPEQCKGLAVDHRSDIYSFGCLMYEALTGIPAAAADSVLESLMLHVNGLQLEFDNTPPAVALKEKSHKKSSAEFSEFKCFNGLRKVIETCTAREPEKRYRSAQELLLDLSAIDRGKTPSGNRHAPLELGLNVSGLSSWFVEKNILKLGVVLVALIAALVPIVLMRAESTSSQKKASSHMDATLSGFLAELDAPKSQHKQAAERLPILKTGNLIEKRILEDRTPASIINDKTFHAGPSRVFSYVRNDDLTVECSTFEPATLKKIENLGCTDYALDNIFVTDQDLSVLARLKKIDWLTLSYSNGFSKEGLKAFNHSSVRKLHLTRTPADDSWAPILAALPLNTIGLLGCKITDKGLSQLAKSKTIRFILVDQAQHGALPAALNDGNWRVLQEKNRPYMWCVRK